MIAILIAFMAFAYASSITSNDSVFEIEVNNTNLAPNVAGHPFGTGERIQNVTYWANSTPIELHVFAHADTVAQALHLNLTINGSEVQHIQLRPLGGSENTYAPITAIIPKGANYSVNITNYHHYEWREYRILSGQNGSVIVNTYNNYTNTTGSGGGGVSFNGTPVNLNGSYLYNGTFDINTNLSLKVNKSGDSMTGNLSMTTNEIQNASKVTVVNTNYNITSGLFGIADIYMVSAGSTVGFYSFGNVNSFSAYRFDNNGTSGDYKYLTTNEQILSFAVGGFNASHTATTNATAGTSRGGMNIIAADNWNETYQPTKTVFLNNNGSSTNTAVTYSQTNNLEINLAGKGIQMLSPNGNLWCTTVTNGGVLSTVAGACT